MCDLICDAITCCVLSCDIGNTNVYNNIIKRGENIESKEISHKSPSKRSFRNGIQSLLRRADARESAA